MAHLFQTLPTVLMVTAFVAAVLSARARGGVASWMSRAPESPARVLLPMVGAALAWPVAILVLATAVTAYVTVTHQGMVDWGYAAMLGAHLSAVILAVALGAFVGRLLSGVPAAIGAVGLLAAVMFLPDLMGWRSLFELIGSGHAVPGLTPASGEHLWNAGWLLLASVVLLWGAARPVLDVRFGVGVLAASLVLLGIGTAKDSGELLVASGVEPDHCMGDSLTVCVYAGYDSQLDLAVPRLEELHERAREAGLDTRLLPTSYSQDDHIRNADREGTVTFGPTAPGKLDFDMDNAAVAVSTPLWCKAMYQDEPPVALLEDMSLVRDWSLLLLGGLTMDEYAERNRPVTNAAAEVPAVMQALQRMNSCVTH
ncbi:hypothetical protein [Nocardioides gilvus]|uniref:hypothetical protein n=1 Tax=Nocardioides gilvus TaxID=1735589 RepID=UPI0013A57555|nr:hypothetical protein [Nocardioides gilvus]